MKAMKKYLALALALIMTLALCVTAFADDTYTITMNSTTGHTYTAYQVFKGDLSEKDGKVTLANIQWGDNVDGDALLTALKGSTDASLMAGDPAKNIFADCTTAADVAKVLGEKVTDNSDAIKAVAKLMAANKKGNGTASTVKEEKIVIEGLAAGYYLVLDTTAAADMPAGDTYSDYILRVVQDQQIDAKDSNVTVEKKVQDINDSTGATSWQDSADYDIGDTIPYEIKGTLPSYIDIFIKNHATYWYEFNDTMSKGLTLDKDSVTVLSYANEADYLADKDGADITADFDVLVTNNQDGSVTLRVICDHMEELTAKPEGQTTAPVATKDSIIVVRYNCTLNENAVIGDAGNPNTVRIIYTNDPHGTSNGKTPEDKVTVFTFQLNVNKKDDKGNDLKGAGFTLYKFDNTKKDYVAVGDEVKGDDMVKFNWTGLDDGQYKLVETTTPVGYNTMEDFFFTVEAEHDATADDPKLTSLVIRDKDGNVISGENKQFTVTLADGAMATDIVNHPGSVLPSTGGIGTTIFYVVGAILAIGAGVVLVTKRRVGDEG